MDGVREWGGKLYLGLSWIFLVAVGVQFFLAGAGVFGAHDFKPHENLGGMLELAALVLVLLSLAWRPGWDTVGMTVLLLVLCVVQHPLAEAQDDHPWIAALHPVNALLIAGLSYMLAQRARRLVLMRPATA